MNTLRRFQIDDPLSDIDGVITYPFQEAGDEQQIRYPLRMPGFIGHELSQRVEGQIAHLIHLPTPTPYRSSQLHVSLEISLQCLCHHLLPAISQFPDQLQALAIQWFLQIAGRPRNVKSMITDALDVR